MTFRINNFSEKKYYTVQRIHTHRRRWPTGTAAPSTCLTAPANAAGWLRMGGQSSVDRRISESDVELYAHFTRVLRLSVTDSQSDAKAKS